MSIRYGRPVAIGLALALGAYGIGQATDAYGMGKPKDKEQAVVTVQVSSAEHEMQEGYFSLGEDATLMVKPGTELHRFLSRQRGQNVTITITEGTGKQLSRLDRH